MKTKLTDQGFIVGTLLSLIIIVSILLLTITSTAIGNWQSAVSENARTNSQLAADAGLDQAVYEINLSETWPGTGPIWNGSAWVGTIGEQDFYNTGTIRTTYEVSVTDSGTDAKTVRSIGRTYQPASSTTAKVTRIFELELRAVTSGISGAGVVAGVGGLYMNNNSKITGGDVIIGGFLDMSNQSQIGLSSTPTANAVNLWISHYNCPNPANATFPRLCGSGENGTPITMQNNAKIYADVHANNQPTSPVNPNITNPGVTLNTGVPQVSVPTYDRTTHGAWSSTATSASSVGCANNNGTRTWNAGLKISGNIDMKNNCKLTINGDVWITGSFKTGNNGEIIVPNSVGTTRPVIMVDDVAGFELQNNGKITPNSFGTGVEIRTFWSAASCSPNCATVTGSDLKNSQDQETIKLSNNGQASNSVFIAQWSQVLVSNNGILGAISGQSIELSNQAVINFTASVPGSSNLHKTWVKRGYLRVFQ